MNKQFDLCNINDAKLTNHKIEHKYQSGFHEEYCLILRVASETSIDCEKELNHCVKAENHVYDLNPPTKIELADQKRQAYLKDTGYRQEQILVATLPVLFGIIHFHVADIEHSVVDHLVFEINDPRSIDYGLNVFELKGLDHRNGVISSNNIHFPLNF